MKKLLDVKNLSASVGNKRIISNMTFSLDAGELAVLMGPNGSGKSTLAYALAGHPRYRVRATKLSFNRYDLKKIPAHERARLGIFLGFQYPLEVDGVALRALVTAARNDYKKREIIQRSKTIRRHLSSLNLNEEILERSVNEGLSGGERKKSEVFQMLALSPKLAILDEPDSGLDVDALKLVARAIARMRLAGCAVLLITHYERILKYLKPDHVHVLSGGKLAKTGGVALARAITRDGFASVLP